MVYVNKCPERGNVCLLRVMGHREMIEEDPGSDKRPSQLRVAQ